MKSRCYSNLFPIIIVLASPILLMAQSNYRIQTLGELGGSSASANGINDRGWITGAANLPGDLTSMATLWLKGVPVPLGTLQNGPNSAMASSSEFPNWPTPILLAKIFPAGRFSQPVSPLDVSARASTGRTDR